MKTRMPFLRAFVVENKIVLICILLFFLVEKAFYPCVGNDFSNFDDQDYVYQNTHVVSGLSIANVIWAFSSTTSANWHPLTMLSHMLDCQLYGLQPWGHHLTSVILHCFNCMLLFLVLQRLTGAVWKSFWVALLFGLHPLHVESVAWISERKDVLSTLFWMLALLAYAAYVDEVKTKQTGGWTYYSFALLWFLLGLMSKPMLVTFPFVLLLLDFWPLERWKGEGVSRSIKEKAPFFLISGLFSFITCFTQRAAMYPIRHMPISERIENVPLDYCRYIGKILYPVNLSVFYPYPTHWPAVRVIASAMLLLIISVMIVMAWRRHPFALVGWLWFLGTLFPVIGLVQVGTQSIADRYSYIPSIGIFIILVWSACEIAKQWNVPLPTLWSFAIGVAMICGVLTRNQISYWKSGESLFRHAIAVTENNYVAYGIIGLHDLGMTNYEGAITNLQKALQIRDDMVNIHVALGLALTKMARPDEAISTLRGAILFEPTNAVAHEEIAMALLAKGRRDEALTNLLYALKQRPDYLEAKMELFKLTNSPSSGTIYNY